MDIHAKSQQLLESIANSMCDRLSPDKYVFFTTQELHVVERFLKDFVRDVVNKVGEY
jgi:hypothetical protein